MIKKKNAGSITLLVLSVALLTGCGTGGSSASGSSGSTATSTSSGNADSLLTPTIDVSSQAGYAAGRNFFDNYMAADKEFNVAANVSTGESFMPNKGRSKLLVVPVVFSDDATTDTQKENNRETMRKIFFGEASETTWQSVRSYYYASSFHQLYFEGEVSKTITMNKTYSDYISSKATTAVNSVAEELFDKLFYNDGAQYKDKESDFDSNNDGVIDGIYFVPNSPVDSKTNLGWAFTTHHYFTTARIAASHARYAKLGTYCWTSLDFCNRVVSAQGSLSTPDAHTYIHEMGHQLGLNDYYDPATQGSATAGGSTMQDENICDHDIYSKYLFGWISPQIVTDKNTESSLTITLKPSESSGDALVLASGFNGTAMDEYVIFEYYTPTGLNEQDSKKSYESSTQQGVNAKGIRAWHIDKNLHQAHMAKGKDSSGKTTDVTYFDPNPVDTVVTNGADAGYTLPDDIAPEDNALHTDDAATNQDDNFYTCFTTNNSTNYSNDNFYISPELEVIRADKGEATTAAASEVMTSGTLFKQGSTFGASTDAFKNFEFYSPASTMDYDGGASDWKAAGRLTLPYSVAVTSITDESATLTLTKLA